MTATTLTLLIACALAAQVTVAAAAAWRRRRRDFLLLDASPSHASPDPSPPGDTSTDGSAWPGLREFVVERREPEDPGGAICAFDLVPTDGGPLPPYRPGQYLTLALALPATDGDAPRRVTRCYSLSTAPDPHRYRISVKRVPAPQGQPDAAPGLVSNHLHDAVGVGTRIQVKAPAGRFHLQAEAAVPLVLIAGGIGITPLLSILETVVRDDPGREVWLFYGVRNGTEHVRKARLEALAAAHPGVHLHVCYSAPTASDRPGIDFRHAGRIDVDLLRMTLRPARHAFYVCGPAPMMQTLVPALADWGVPAADIHYEAFGPSTVRPPREAQPTAASAAITFSRSGRTLPWQPAAESLLAFAEGHGIAVESGCRSGSCGGCQTRLEQGEVSYMAEPVADVADGHCLLCISVPKGPVTLGA